MSPDVNPIPGADGLAVPEGSCTNGVLVLAEALGEAELKDGGKPLRPWAPAGSVFERVVRRAGFDRDQFVLYNTVPTHPPKNYLEGAPYEAAAIAWGIPYLDKVVADYKPRCILALGNVATKALTGLTGEQRGVSSLRGWVLPSRLGIPVVPTFHPSFLRREAMELFPVLMHDMKLAVAVASGLPKVRFFSPVVWRDWEYVANVPCDPERPRVPPGYVTHPSLAQAEDFLREAESATLISYDIETPRSAASDENSTDELGDIEILSIQFSARAGTGIFFPWREPFIEISKRVLAAPGDKAGANTWRFDDPLLEAHGCRINGRRHDVRWLWKHLQPDMKASLQFIASFYQVPGFSMPWKHLNHTHPTFYGIADVDAIQRIMT